MRFPKPVSSPSPRWAPVPNAITLGRLCAVPLVVWLMLKTHHTAAFWVFVIAGVSDALDGFIAKRYRAASLVGSYLDPIADKALLVSVYVALGLFGAVPLWLVILVVFRDILIVAGAVLVETLTRSLTMAPLMISKVNTTAQIMLAGLVMGEAAFGLEMDEIRRALVYAVGATTFLSGAAYVVTWSRRAGEMEHDRGPDDTSGGGNAA